jgi:hypothetical protein
LLNFRVHTRHLLVYGLIAIDIIDIFSPHRKLKAERYGLALAFLTGTAAKDLQQQKGYYQPNYFLHVKQRIEETKVESCGKGWKSLEEWRSWKSFIGISEAVLVIPNRGVI